MSLPDCFLDKGEPFAILGSDAFVASLIMLGHGYAKERSDTDNQRWARRQLPNQATKNLVNRDRGKFVVGERVFYGTTGSNHTLKREMNYGTGSGGKKNR